MSLPGLSLTWKTAMTGRWSEVFMLEQLLYFSTRMSVVCLLLNTTLSWENKRAKPHKDLEQRDAENSRLSSYCVWGRSLLGGGIVVVTADVKFICWEEVNRCFLETFKNRTCTETDNQIRQSTGVILRKKHKIKFWGKLVGWSQKNTRIKL